MMGRPRAQGRKRLHKRDLPQKTCPVCLRPFAWRKKWAACWDEVRYCSARCRSARHDAPEDAIVSSDATH